MKRQKFAFVVSFFNFLKRIIIEIYLLGKTFSGVDSNSSPCNMTNVI